MCILDKSLHRLINYQDQVGTHTCEEHWKNMSPDVTKRMWGIFNEMGIFLSLCRHGFTLVIADMVRSSEM
jgi:hypothetical protein